MSRLLSEVHHKRVVVVDTSNEIGGDGDIAHPGIGRARRMQVTVHVSEACHAEHGHLLHIPLAPVLPILWR